MTEPYRRDRASGLAYVYNSAFTGFQVALGATMPLVREDLGFSLTVASLHFTVMAVVGMTASNLVAPVVHRFGRRLPVLAAVCAALAGSVILMLAPHVAITLMAVALLGAAGPFTAVISQAELLDKHPRHRAPAMAELNLVASVAMMTTTLGIGPLVAESGTWRVAMLLPIAAMLPVPLIATDLPFSDMDAPRRPRSAQRMTRLAWIFCLLIMAQTAFEWSYGYLGAEFLDTAGGLSKESAVTALTTFYAGMVVSRFALVRLVRKFSPYQLLLASFGVASAGFLLLAGGPGPAVKIAGPLISGLGVAITFPMIVSLAGAAFPHATDWILGKIYVYASLAIAAAPFAIGALGDQIRIARSFWALGIVGLAGLALCQVLNRALRDQGTSPGGQRADT